MKIPISKRIKILTPTFEPYEGGVETHIQEVYKRLVSQGWSIFVESSNFNKKQSLFSVKKNNIDGISSRRYHFLILKFLWLNPFWWLGIHRGDIVEFQNFLPLPGYFVCGITAMLNFLGIKWYYLVLSSHGWWEITPEMQSSWFRVFLRRVNLILGIFLLKHSVDRYKVVNAIEKKLLEDQGLPGSNIEVIQNGVDERVFSFGKRGKIKERYGDYIVQFSRIARVKNIETSIASMSYVPRNLKLLVLGGIYDEVYFKELIELVKKLSLEDRVLFIGNVSGDEKFEFLKQSSVYLQLSDWESFSIGFLEALSQGAIPVVWEKSPMAQIIIQNKCGFLVANHRDSVEVGKAISTILELSSEEREVVRGACVKIAEQYTWGNISKKTEKFYNELVNF